MASSQKQYAIEEKRANRTNGTIRMSRLHDIRRFRITLKQWRMLHAVVDCGGFSGAAEFLHTSQSTISYAISKLQEQVGVRLLKVEGRKAQVTEEGRAILERSRYLIKNALEIEAYAESLQQGWKSEVRLVVDRNFPTALLMPLLQKHSTEHRDIKVRLAEVSLPKVEHALADQTADLAITENVPLGFLGKLLFEFDYVFVAHPGHALCRHGDNVTSAHLAREVMIVVCDGSESMFNDCLPGSTPEPWRVSSIETALCALRQGLGYAWMPRHRIRESLEKGELAVVPLDGGRTYRRNFYIVYGRAANQNTVVKMLAEELQAALAPNRADS